MPNVLCWESVVADEAAKLFSVEFFKALEKDGSYDSPQLHPNQDPDPILNPNANPKPNPNPNPNHGSIHMYKLTRMRLSKSWTRKWGDMANP